MKLLGAKPTQVAIRLGLVAYLAMVAVFVGALLHSAGASSSPPVVVLSPSGALKDGEAVSVSVGPNSVFTPHSRISILECADPGGTTANLPKDISTCDGNTIQGNTILVADNGSFSVSGYTVYQLPSVALGEEPSGQPVCNQTSACVLFVGQDQNDFSSPKVFSAPLSIGAASGSGTSNTGLSTTTTAAGSVTTTAAGQSATTPTTGATNSSTPTTTAAGVALSAGSDASTDDASVAGDAAAIGSTAAPGTLPNTGVSTALLWLFAVGTMLILGGSLGRLVASRVSA